MDPRKIILISETSGNLYKLHTKYLISAIDGMMLFAIDLNFSSNEAKNTLRYARFG